jgi:hypothetical protein
METGVKKASGWVFNLCSINSILHKTQFCMSFLIYNEATKKLSKGYYQTFSAISLGRKIMELYKNKGGGSEVWAYEIGDDSITIQFTDGSKYMYNYHSAGNENIEKMKVLAISGRGLYRYIMRDVKKAFAVKLA